MTREPVPTTPPAGGARRAFSVSSTTTYETCPRRYRFGYVERIPTDRAEAPEPWRFGTVVHAGLEAGYAAHRDRGTGPDLTPVIPDAVAAVRAAWASEVMPDDPARLAEAEALVTRALTEERLEPGDILGVEHRFRAETTDGVRIHGISDLVVRTAPDAVEVRDHKVTRAVRTPEQLRGDLQLGVYGWLARATWPWATRVVVAHHYPLTGALVRVDLDDAWIDAALARVRGVAGRVAGDTEFAPTPGDHCRNCAYTAICDAALVRT
jgi:putative RecB family exonuclease